VGSFNGKHRKKRELRAPFSFQIRNGGSCCGLEESARTTNAASTTTSLNTRCLKSATATVTSATHVPRRKFIADVPSTLFRNDGLERRLHVQRLFLPLLYFWPAWGAPHAQRTMMACACATRNVGSSNSRRQLRSFMSGITQANEPTTRLGRRNHLCNRKATKFVDVART
jgi:hypothetical protein